jgi:hypothetical protein
MNATGWKKDPFKAKDYPYKRYGAALIPAVADEDHCMIGNVSMWYKRF